MSALRVAMTFDAEHPDRPSTPGTDEALLDLLAARGVPATFFVQGRWAQARPTTMARIVAEGHLLGSHSHYHARMPLLTDAGLGDDLAAAAAAIEATAGVDPRPWFRCPFGAGAADRRVLAAVAAAGFRHVGWHVAADDWDPARGADVIAADVVDGVRAHGDQAVVLLHSWPSAMLGALDPILARLDADGARFVRVDELADPPTEVP